MVITSDGTAEDIQNLNDFCLKNQYQDTINGEPNPQTKFQFAKAVIRGYVVSDINQGASMRYQASLNPTVTAQ